MAMLVYRRVVLAKELVGVVGFLQCDLHFGGTTARAAQHLHDNVMKCSEPGSFLKCHGLC